jgi:AhpD family alkylhydroperoxidase
MERPNPFKASPKSYQAMAALENFVTSCGLERPLLELVKMRASQINGCAYCLDMHSKDARALGESEQRLYLLNAWRETPFYTERERAGIPGSGQALQRGGACEPDPGDRHDQQLEPAEHFVPHRAWLIQVWSSSAYGDRLRLRARMSRGSPFSTQDLRRAAQILYTA